MLCGVGVSLDTNIGKGGKRDRANPAELQEGKVTKKFDKAKAETIQKWSGVLKAVSVAKKERVGQCGFCRAYGHCEGCPVEDLCEGKLHRAVVDLMEELEAKVIEGISLLHQVEEKVRV